MYIKVPVHSIKQMDNVYPLFFYVEVSGFVCVCACVCACACVQISVNSWEYEAVVKIKKKKNRGLNSSMGLSHKAPK